MIPQSSVWCILGAGLFLAYGGSAQEKEKAKTQDKKLLAAVKAAVEKGIKPDKVETAVGVKATLNTVRKFDREALGEIDFGEDPEREPALPDLDSLRWVVYWCRPVEFRGCVKIVGIYWPKKGKPQMFFGVVAPPG